MAERPLVVMDDISKYPGASNETVYRCTDKYDMPIPRMGCLWKFKKGQGATLCTVNRKKPAGLCDLYESLLTIRGKETKCK